MFLDRVFSQKVKDIEAEAVIFAVLVYREAKNIKIRGTVTVSDGVVAVWREKVPQNVIIITERAVNQTADFLINDTQKVIGIRIDS